MSTKINKETLIAKLNEISLSNIGIDKFSDGFNQALTLVFEAVEELTKPWERCADECEWESDCCMGHEIQVCKNCGDVC